MVATATKWANRVFGVLLSSMTGYWVYSSYQEYQSLLHMPYSSVKDFDHGSTIIKHVYEHPTTKDQAILIPLPVTQKMRVYQVILTELLSNVELSAKLPIFILQGFTEPTESGRYQCDLRRQINYTLLELLFEDLTMTFMKQWKQGKAEGLGSAVETHTEDFFNPSVEALGLPYIRGDLPISQLSPLTQLYLLHIACTIPVDLTVLPRDSPLWEDFVPKRSQAAVNCVKHILANRTAAVKGREESSIKSWFSWFTRRSNYQYPVGTPCTLVLPWHKLNCPQIEEGLKQLCFVEVSRNTQSVGSVPFVKWLYQSGGTLGYQRFSVEVFELAKLRHSEIMKIMNAELKQIAEASPTSYQAMLQEQLAAHIKACRVTGSLELDEGLTAETKNEK